MRIHLDEQKEWHPLYGSHLGFGQASLAAQAGFSRRIHKAVQSAYPRMVRNARNDGVGNWPGKDCQGMEAKMEIGAD